MYDNKLREQIQKKQSTSIGRTVYSLHIAAAQQAVRPYV